MPDQKDLFTQLEYAKKAVIQLIEKHNCSIDFKGLIYWATRVEELRHEIKSKL